MYDKNSEQVRCKYFIANDFICNANAQIYPLWKWELQVMERVSRTARNLPLPYWCINN
jgi:hypothetical protein